MSRRRQIDWPAVAAAMAARFPVASLHPAVTTWADGASDRRRWNVALSGGADSVALLLLLWAHWPRKRKRLRVLHFDHRLRGAESRADAAFCRRFAAALAVEYREEVWRDARKDASEAEARRARMAFFRRHGTVLWLGHQQDDIAETLLMRLARGSGSGGLAAPRPLHRFEDERLHLRPLLTLKKAALRSALEVAGGQWREDSTNPTRRYLRNRMRHDVVRRWQEASGERDAPAGAARTRELLEEDDAALAAWLAELAPLDARGALNRRRLAGKPKALVRRALLQWLSRQTAAGRLGEKGVSRQAVDAILDDLLCGRVTRHSLGKAGFAELGRTRVTFSLAPGRKIAG